MEGGICLIYTDLARSSIDHSRVHVVGCPGVPPGTSSPESLHGLTEGHQDGSPLENGWSGHPAWDMSLCHKLSGTHTPGTYGEHQEVLAIWEGMAKAGITKNGGTVKRASPTVGKGGSPDAWPQGEQVSALASNSGGKGYYLALSKGGEEI